MKVKSNNIINDSRNSLPEAEEARALIKSICLFIKSLKNRKLRKLTVGPTSPGAPGGPTGPRDPCYNKQCKQILKRQRIPYRE